MSLVVYTAIFGAYEELIPPKVVGRFICFTDGSVAPCDGWKLFQVPGELGPIKEARRFKLQPHRYLLDADCSIWIDANIELLADPETLAGAHLAHRDLALHQHPARCCIYDEARVCAEIGRDSADILEEQARLYRAAGYPADGGLYETGVLLRHHTAEVARMNDAWWAEVQALSGRDQVSLPYVLWKLGMEPGLIAGALQTTTGPDFRYRPHLRRKVSA